MELIASREARECLRAFLSEASFWTPDLLIPETPAWIEHAPFAFWLTQALRPRVFVELGAHRGSSYFVFCAAVQRLRLDTRCYAVDTWKGDEHAGYYGEDVFQNVTTENEARYSAFSSLVRSTFEAASSHFKDASIDLLHIDGRHRYEDVKRDFDSWRPKLSNHAIVLFHDTNVRERDFGVHRFWDEISRDYPHFEFLHGHGLGILGTGSRVPPPAERLFATNSDQDATAAVRLAYARLGRSFRAELTVRHQAAELDLRQREIDSERSAAAAARNALEAKCLQAEKMAVEVQHLNERETELRRIELELELEIATLRTTVQSQTNELRRRESELELEIATLKTEVETRTNETSVRAVTPNSIRRDCKLIRASGLFDEDWYLRVNPDVASSRLSPIEHYILYGARERRNPSTRFDGNRYLEENRDVTEAGINPLVHYLRYGRHEGRPAPSLSSSAGETLLSLYAFDYWGPTEGDIRPLRIALGSSSRGNFFMREMGLMLDVALRNIGMETKLFDENSAGEILDFDVIVVVAPHEFFVIDGERAWSTLSKHPALVVINTEQPQTQWFAHARRFSRPTASSLTSITQVRPRCGLQAITRTSYLSDFVINCSSDMPMRRCGVLARSSPCLSPLWTNLPSATLSDPSTSFSSAPCRRGAVPTSRRMRKPSRGMRPFSTFRSAMLRS